jgi:hypothetical protein
MTLVIVRVRHWWHRHVWAFTVEPGHVFVRCAVCRVESRGLWIP